MSNKEDWKKIEEYLENREIENRNKYNFDIDAKPWEKLTKFRRVVKTVKFIFIIIICIILISSVSNMITFKDSIMRIDYVRSYLGNEVEETKVKTYLLGKGFYTYHVKGIPELEIHALYVSNNEFKEDISSRYYKYFFEKWEDSEKCKFVVTENYEDCKYLLTKKKNWLLNYETYIEISTYEELLEATEIIIRFINYMNNPIVLVDSYIKIGNEKICPHNATRQSVDEIRNMAKQQYFSIIEKNKL